MCPNCKSQDTWNDVSAWGCNKCGWCSLQMLNRSPTVSYPRNPHDVKERADSWGFDEDQEYKKRTGFYW